MRFWLYSLILGVFMHRPKEWERLPSVSGKKTIWFHAASAGELEILMPLIEEAVMLEKKVGVSIYSRSADSWLKKLPAALVFRGYSPSESGWQPMFEHFGVSEVITSKYEAWPGLWKAASTLSIRVTVVCAQMRSSLFWARRLLKWFGVALPKLRFFALDESGVLDLKVNFPTAECVVGADPRWLRVSTRAEAAVSHIGVQKWFSKNAQAPKPFWVIGSAWPEDMDRLSESIRNFKGTVWVVPHSLKERPDPKVYAPHSNCVLVDEMGLLVELYSIADRAWVGGGFGQGIHSTLEPSVYFIPVACGPKNVEKFFEARELIAAGMLTVCESSKNIQAWLDKPSQKAGFPLKLKLEMIEKMMGSILK